MATNVLPYTDRFYTVAEMIADLKAGKFHNRAPYAQRPLGDGVTHDARTGKPMEHANGFGLLVREAQPAELYPVGTRIFCRFLQMEAVVVATTATRIRVEWNEQAIKGCPVRRGWLSREDVELAVEQGQQKAAHP